MQGCKKGQVGSILIELVFVMPLILLLALGAVELGRAFRASSVAVTISREMASIAYRECTDLSDSAMAGCLDARGQAMQAFANLLAPGTQIIISLHWSIATTTPRAVWSPAGDPNDRSVPPSHSRYGTPDFTGLNQHRFIALSEVFVPYQTMVPFLEWLFGGLGGVVYDETIL